MEQSGTWIGIAAIAVTGLLALANKIVERRHSAEIADLKRKARTQSRRSKRSDTKLAACEEKHKACEERHVTTDARLAAVEAQITPQKG